VKSLILAQIERWRHA